MNRRTVLSAAAAIAVLGGAGAFAVAHAEGRPPTLSRSAAHYTAPVGKRDGAFTFTTEVTASSGVKSLKVLAWPANSTFARDGLTRKDMAGVESATCEPAVGDTARCTYRVAVGAGEAAASERGPWHVATLATAGDGSTAFDRETTTVTIG